ncbi:hypothetical protein CRYUN_Cryun39dG0023900 [Craigia yunnanensis]
MNKLRKLPLLEDSRSGTFSPRVQVFEVKLPRSTRVKNKTPAPIQVTAEQILREAREQQEAEIRPPKQKITDTTELADYPWASPLNFHHVTNIK